MNRQKRKAHPTVFSVNDFVGVEKLKIIGAVKFSRFVDKLDEIG